MNNYIIGVCREVYRYYAVLMRQRFDVNKNVQDMRVAKELLAKGEDELFNNAHWQIKKCRATYDYV